MTTIIDPDVIAGDWGIWDRHLHTWLALGYETERDAWQRRLELDSPHPWELVVAEIGEYGGPIVRCICGGNEDCYECDGTGEVEEL